MKTLRHLLLTGLCAVLGTLPAWGASPEPEARVIVRFKPQADSVRAKILSARAGESEAQTVAQTRATALGLRRGQALAAGRSLDERTHVVTASGLSSAALAAQLAGDPEVELVAIDHRRKLSLVPNDPLFGSATVNPESANPDGSSARIIDQWYLKTAGAVAGQAVSSINAPAAWDITTGSASVIVAVLDTGVRRDHPDLAGKFVSGYDVIEVGGGANASAIANRPAGADRTLALDYGDFVTQAEVNSGVLGSGCTSADVGGSSWHGTRVSGLIAAASNNGQGMAGVGWGVKIQPIRVLGKCGGYDSDIVAGMLWAAGISVPGLPANPNKAKVLNMSLGGDGSCSVTGSTGRLYQDTISQVSAAGAVVVVAAGNSEGQAVGVPGNCPGVVTVTGLRHVGSKVGFSSLGTEVTVAAPGGNCINVGAGQPCLYTMVSTTNSGATNPVLNDASYTGSSASVGTSFATPLVSGVVALMSSVRPGLTSSEASNLLKSTSRRFFSTGSASLPAPPKCTVPSATAQDECYCPNPGDGVPLVCGAGMVDAGAAVAAAQALNGTTVSISPSPASGLQAGQTLTLTSALTGLPAGRSVASIAWTVVNSGSIVTGFASGSTTASATIVPSAAGSFIVQVQYTDDQGVNYPQLATISVAAVPVVTPTPTPTPSGGGGSGGTSPLWLALLALAAWAVKPRPTVVV